MTWYEYVHCAVCSSVPLSKCSASMTASIGGGCMARPSTVPTEPSFSSLMVSAISVSGERSISGVVCFSSLHTQVQCTTRQKKPSTEHCTSTTAGIRSFSMLKRAHLSRRAREQSRKQTLSLTRPARPFRCSRLVFEAHTVAEFSILLCDVNNFIRVLNMRANMRKVEYSYTVHSEYE